MTGPRKKYARAALLVTAALSLTACSGLSRDGLVSDAVKSSPVSQRISKSVSKLKVPGFLNRNRNRAQPAATAASDVQVAPTVTVPTSDAPPVNATPPLVNANPAVSGQMAVLAPFNPLLNRQEPVTGGYSPVLSGDVLALPQRVAKAPDAFAGASVSPDTGLSYLQAGSQPPAFSSGFSSGFPSGFSGNTANGRTAQPIRIAPLESNGIQYGGIQNGGIPNGGIQNNGRQPILITPIGTGGPVPAFPSNGPRYASLQPVLQPGSLNAGQNPGGQKPQIALLLPTGAGGGIGQAAQQMRNAALLARADSGSTVDLKFYDTQGTAAAAQSAAVQAVNKGANLILGPLAGSNVGAVHSVAQSRGVNIIGFSNDMSQARPGAFLLGLGPDQSVERIVSYAASRGLRRIAVLSPQSAYGRRALQTARATAYASGVTIVGPFTYAAPAGSEERKSAAKAVGEAQDGFDAILIADNARSAREMGALLLFNQVDPGQKQILGTDLWNVPGVHQETGLRGALYAATDDSRWQSFRTRYRSQFGEDPQRLAGIAYDAVQLASRLASSGSASSGSALSGLYSASSLTGAGGANGLFGAYRLSISGRNIRALDIRRVGSGGSAVVERAAQFAGL